MNAVMNAPAIAPSILPREPQKKWHRLFGCLGIIVLLAAGAGWLWIRSLATLRWGCSETVLWAAERACLQCGLSDTKQKQILGPVQSFAASVKTGEFSMQAGIGLIRQFDRGPLFATLFCAALADRLLEPDETGKANEASSAQIVAAFLEEYKTNLSASATLVSLQDLVMEKHEFTFRRPSGMVLRETMPVMKTDLTPEEREEALTLMMKAITVVRNRPDVRPPPLDLAVGLAAALEEILNEGH